MLDSDIRLLIDKLETYNDDELKKLVYKLIEERNSLANKMNIDTLSGVYNRGVINSINDFNIAVMCDIDNFKGINDTYGHLVGDQIIKGVADVLKNNTRSNDYVCRYGGDEFFIAFSGCSLDVVVDRMQKILKDVSDMVKLPDRAVTLSVGIAEKEKEEDINSAISKADSALYQSKQGGKNKVSIYKQLESDVSKKM